MTNQQQVEPTSALNPTLPVAPSNPSTSTTLPLTATTSTAVTPAAAAAAIPASNIPQTDIPSTSAAEKPSSQTPATPASLFKGLRFKKPSTKDKESSATSTTIDTNNSKPSQQTALAPLANTMLPTTTNTIVTNTIDGGASVVVNIDTPAVKILNSNAVAKDEAFWYFKEEVGGGLGLGKVNMAKGFGLGGGGDVIADRQTNVTAPPATSLFSALFGGMGGGGGARVKEEDNTPIDPNAHKVPFNNLEEEIKLFLPKVHVVRLLDRFVLFNREEEAALFKEIRKYQKKSPSATRSDAFETFGGKKYGEALIRIAFNEHMDQFMTYRNFDYFGKNLEKYRYQLYVAGKSLAW